MNYWTEFVAPTGIKTVKKYNTHSRSCTEYLNIPSAFDIETTSTYIDGDEKFAFMYEWTFGIDNQIVYGRTWDEFLQLLHDLQEIYELDGDRILIVYVHNLSYEFQFMRKYLDWVNVFAVDDRKPIKALCSLGIEFRDSYILSGYSLANTAKNLTSHTVAKLVGDLDYKLVRTAETPLTEQELGYCYNDVLIILYYIAEQIELYGDINKVPLTNTGRVRKFVKDKCLHTSKNHRKDSGSKYKRYRAIMEDCTLTVEQYQLLKQAFQGGFTHASMQYSGKILQNVSSIDFTSSYPAVMLSEFYPMSKPIPVENVSRETFEKLRNTRRTGMLFTARFTNLHSRTTYETYLSESKCSGIKGGMINNGRVFHADELYTTITDIDLDIIEQCYEFDTMDVANLHYFVMDYLPKSIISSILELYEKKTTLKNVEGKEVEYLLSKGMLNSVYGMCVTDIVRDEITYSGEWSKQHVSRETMQEQIEKYNDNTQRFLYYPWGVWVTAYARRNLWNGILAIGDDYIYSDTDSIKFLNYEKHTDYIEQYNKQISEKLQTMCRFFKFDYSRCAPRTIKGIEKPIGVWDVESVNMPYFKTLGAKRYIYWDKDLHITVAGLSKSKGAEFLKSGTTDILQMFDKFNNNMYVPSNSTGKNTHTYIDYEQSADITDYLGHTVEVTSLSSIHLSETDFTLSLTKEYQTFLAKLAKGEIYAGTSLYYN